MEDLRNEAQQANAADFIREVEQNRPGFLYDFWTFLRYNKRWWLTPIILVLLFIGVFAILGGTAAAPFIYTLF